MAINRRIRDAAWHETIVRENDYCNALAGLSLANKGVKNPNFLQLRIEALFLSHKLPINSIFLLRFQNKSLGVFF